MITMNKSNTVRIIRNITLVLIGILVFPIGLIEIGWFSHKWYSARQCGITYNINKDDSESVNEIEI